MEARRIRGAAVTLHGEIKINNIAIGIWQARRASERTLVVNKYLVRVSFKDISGVVHRAEGELEHAFSDGALVLISKIMLWANQQFHLPTENPEFNTRLPGEEVPDDLIEVQENSP
jgi:hypothetical protein